jgi:acetyl-CoA carboxylase carboxyl transferase subunit alpha
MPAEEKQFMPLEFEKPLLIVEDKIRELQQVAIQTGTDLNEEIIRLQHQAHELRSRLHENLTPSQKLQVARHPQRPNFLELVRGLSPETWFELHGDRAGMDDRAILGGIVELDGMPALMVGNQKGRNMKENLVHNFGMANPEGYRKAMRLFQHAEKFKMPIVTVIDTPGAYPGMQGEEHAIGHAIAWNIREMARLQVPIISIVTGEASSGGALGIGVSDRILMLEHALYTVISPEGCASILWRSAEYAARAAEALRITAQELKGFGIIDAIIEEPQGGAHYDPALTIQRVSETLIPALRELKQHNGEQLRSGRYEKFRRIGAFQELSLTPA